MKYLIVIIVFITSCSTQSTGNQALPEEAIIQDESISIRAGGISRSPP